MLPSMPLISTPFKDQPSPSPTSAEAPSLPPSTTSPGLGDTTVSDQERNGADVVTVIDCEQDAEIAPNRTCDSTNPGNYLSLPPKKSSPLKLVNPILKKYNSHRQGKILKRSLSPMHNPNHVSFAYAGTGSAVESENAVAPVDNEADLAALMEASSTVPRPPRGKQAPVNKKKRLKELRDAKVMLALLAADSKQYRAENARNFAQAFYHKLQERLEENSDGELFRHVLQLLGEFEARTTPVRELYERVTTSLRNYPDLAELFDVFLLPEQAMECGRFMQRLRLINMKTFVRRLEVFFAKQPQQFRQVLSTLTSLRERPDLTMNEVRSAVLPLFKSNTFLIDSFLFLFPDERPPESLMTDWEVMEMDSDHSGDEAECVHVPDQAGVPDRYGTDDCVCPCHATPHAPHCFSCGTKFIHGRVYVHVGRTLRPAKVIFPGSSPDAVRRRLYVKAGRRARRNAASSPSKTPNHEESDELKSPKVARIKTLVSKARPNGLKMAKNEQSEVKPTEALPNDEIPAPVAPTTPDIPRADSKPISFGSATPDIPGADSKLVLFGSATPDIPRADSILVSFDSATPDIPRPDSKLVSFGSATPDIPRPDSKLVSFGSATPDIPRPDSKLVLFGSANSDIPRPDSKLANIPRADSNLISFGSANDATLTEPESWDNVTFATDTTPDENISLGSGIDFYTCDTVDNADTGDVSARTRHATLEFTGDSACLLRDLLLPVGVDASAGELNGACDADADGSTVTTEATKGFSSSSLLLESFLIDPETTVRTEPDTLRKDTATGLTNKAANSLLPVSPISSQDSATSVDPKVTGTVATTPRNNSSPLASNVDSTISSCLTDNRLTSPVEILMLSNAECLTFPQQTDVSPTLLNPTADFFTLPSQTNHPSIVPNTDRFTLPVQTNESSTSLGTNADRLTLYRGTNDSSTSASPNADSFTLSGQTYDWSASIGSSLTLTVENNYPSEGRKGGSRSVEGAKLSPRAWTREEDRLILVEVQLGFGMEETFVNIKKGLPDRAMEEIRERFHMLMKILQEMTDPKEGETKSTTSTSTV